MIPNRASDAGPEPCEPIDYHDHLYEAERAIKEAIRTYADTVSGHRSKRKDAIDRAKASLEAAERLI